VELVADRNSKRPFDAEVNFAARVAQAAMRRGLLLYPVQGCVDGIAGDHLVIAPPAIITSEQIIGAVEQLREAIKESIA
jgi:adenosylmethionine-8-amino-7-oxononanoate aminotransferase